MPFPLEDCSVFGNFVITLIFLLFVCLLSVCSSSYCLCLYIVHSWLSLWSWLILIHSPLNSTSLCTLSMFFELAKSCGSRFHNNTSFLYTFLNIIELIIGKVGSYCSTSGTRRVTIVTNPVKSHVIFVNIFCRTSYMRI